MGRKHTEESKTKIAATRLQRFGATAEDRKRKASERYKRWVIKNPERARAIKDDWRLKHRERLNAEQRERNKDPERKAFMREYAPKHRAANKDRYLDYTHKRRAAEAQAAGCHTDAEWTAKLAIFGGCCAYCQASGKMTRDHDVPLARGGSNDIGNILPACACCNSRKGTLTGEEYRARLRGEPQAIDERWAATLVKARANSPRGKRAA